MQALSASNVVHVQSSLRPLRIFAASALLPQRTQRYAESRKEQAKA